MSFLPQMKLEEFVQRYPWLSRKQIAQIAGCKPTLVDRWFMKGRTGKHPSETHETRFDLAHWFWTQSAERPPFFALLTEIYTQHEAEFRGVKKSE